MKLEKTRNRFCKKCKKHTEHRVLESKQRTFGTAHPQSHGSRAQARHKAMTGNTGRYSRPPIKNWGMTGAKQCKKTDLRFQCSVCKKSHTQRVGVRLRKIEFK